MLYQFLQKLSDLSLSLVLDRHGSLGPNDSDDSDRESDQPSSGAAGGGGASKEKPPIPPGHHRLQSTYCLWFSRKTGGKQAQNAFDQNLRKIGTFSTCEQFWDLYGHIVFPGEMSSHSDFHLFKDGIKPMWEVSQCFLPTMRYGLIPPLKYMDTSSTNHFKFK